MTRDVRYVLSDAPLVNVIAEFNEYYSGGNYYRETDKSYQAGLIDLSKHGAKLSSSAIIPTGESVRLKLTIEDLGIEFYVAGEVCWNREQDDGSSLLGCELATGLPDGLFDRLAGEGQLDRRFDSRFEEEVEISALWELDGTQLPVTLRNYSSGGFSILASHPVSTGQRFHLCIDEPQHHIMIAIAHWQLKVANGYLIGASFLNARSFERLSAACQRSLSASPC